MGRETTRPYLANSGGPLKRRIAPLCIAGVMLFDNSPAQELSDVEFQIPEAVGAAELVQTEPRQRLLQLIRHRDWREAGRFAGNLPQHVSVDPQLQYLVGVVQWQQGAKIRAIQHFREAERRGLREPYLHRALGLAYYEAHQFALFEQQMMRAIDADPADPLPYYYLGRYAEAVNGDFASALRHFKQVVALDKGHARGHAYLAYCLERLDRLDAAAQHYRMSIRLLEQNGERFSWPYRGMARLALKVAPEGARAWATRAVEIGSDEFETHALLARVHDNSREVSKAVAAASEAVRINPDHAQSHYLLFTALRRLGDANAAQRHLTRFQELKQAYGAQ